MKTPDGVSESDFRKALQEFANIVGPEWGDDVTRGCRPVPRCVLYI